MSKLEIMPKLKYQNLKCGLNWNFPFLLPQIRFRFRFFCFSFFQTTSPAHLKDGWPWRTAGLEERREGRSGRPSPALGSGRREARREGRSDDDKDDLKLAGARRERDREEGGRSGRERGRSGRERRGERKKKKRERERESWLGCFYMRAFQ